MRTVFRDMAMDMLSNAGWNASESPEYGMLSLAASLFIHYILQFERREHLCSYAIRPHSSRNSSRRPSLIQRTPLVLQVMVKEPARHCTRHNIGSGDQHERMSMLI